MEGSDYRMDLIFSYELVMWYSLNAQNRQKKTLQRQGFFGVLSEGWVVGIAQIGIKFNSVYAGGVSFVTGSCSFFKICFDKIGLNLYDLFRRMKYVHLFHAAEEASGRCKKHSFCVTEFSG